MTTAAATVPAPAAAGGLDPLHLAANEALGKGNLQKAELLCRQLLERSPTDLVALALLGQLATHLQRFDQAVGYFSAGLRAAPHQAQFAQWRDQAEALRQAQAMQPQPAARERFLLIKAWGYGFWSDMDHVLGQLLLADITGRTPIVHWGANSLFGEPGAGNAFELFFEPVSCVSLQDLQRREGLSFFPAKWQAANLAEENLNKFAGPGSRLTGLYALSRDEDVVVSDFHTKLNDLIPWIPEGHALQGMHRNQIYRQMVERHIRLRPELQQKIEAFWQARMQGQRWLAVHVRGSDKAAELRDLDLVNAQYHQRIEALLRQQEGLRIFLLTDSEQFLQDYRGRYGDRVLSADCARTDSHVGVHYTGRSGRMLGEEVILDTFLAARCDFFLGNGASNVSTAVRHLKSWEADRFLLIGPDFLGERNLFLHEW
jgi:hypothetical protein